MLISLKLECMAIFYTNKSIWHFDYSKMICGQNNHATQLQARTTKHFLLIQYSLYKVRSKVKYMSILGMHLLHGKEYKFYNSLVLQFRAYEDPYKAWNVKEIKQN